jgi:signal transduction histidine kinase
VAALVDTAAQLEWERHALGQISVGAERASVARDLHDSVAHCMTVIVLQAAAARRVWATDTDRAAGHVAVLQQAVTDAFAELRPLIVSVALGDPDPGIGINDLARLVERAAAANLNLHLELETKPPPLSEAVGRAGYRIVQEALTNAARHAPGSDVIIRIRHDDDAVHLEIVNGPPRAQPWPMAGAGKGLQGMRERAAACGGSLDVATDGGGGFKVHALLPHTPIP